jgi:hypothetical protein
MCISYFGSLFTSDLDTNTQDLSPPFHILIHITFTRLSSHTIDLLSNQTLVFTTNQP